MSDRPNWLVAHMFNQMIIEDHDIFNWPILW